MSKVIHANYTFNAEEFSIAQIYHSRLNGRRMRWLRWAFLGIMVTTVTTVIIVKGNYNPILLAVLALGYVGVFASEVMQHPKMIQRSIHKRFERGIYQPQEVSFVIDEQKIASKTNGKNAAKIGWDSIQKIVETPEGFLLYRDRHVFLWLPRNSLIQSAASLEKLYTWIQAHHLEVAKLGMAKGN